MTLSAWFPLVRLDGLSQARTRWLMVSTTYIGPPDGAKVTDRGVFSSRPSIKFGAPLVAGLRSLACPNSRDGSSLIVGEPWAHKGTLPSNAKRHNSFIFRILRQGAERGNRPSHQKIPQRENAQYVPSVL